jgi:Protein of unknown function (DUF2838)
MCNLTLTTANHHPRNTSIRTNDDNHEPPPPISLTTPRATEEAETIRKVLLAVQKHEQTRIQEGFNELNFATGVLNSMLVAYVFGNFPEHFWLLWLLEAAALIPRKIYQDWHAQPLRQILYYIDYCWVMTFAIIFSLYYLCIHWSNDNDNDNSVIPYSESWRKHMYLAVLGVGCGSLLCATAAMPFVAMVFHDHKMMTSLFIHLTPSMLVYTFQWHADEIVQAWPNFFQLDVQVTFFPPDKGPFFWPGQGLGTVAGNATALYFLWFLPYTAWMCAYGLDLTRKNRRRKGNDGLPLPTSPYDTAFHCIFRDGIHETIGPLFGRTPEESRRQQAEGDYRVKDFLIIMTVHAVSVWCATMIVASACLQSKAVHAALLWLIVVITVFRGAQQYVYWVTSMCSKAVQEEFAEILKEVEQDRKKGQ